MKRFLPALLVLLAACVTESEFQGRKRQQAGGYLELRQVVPNAKVQAVLTVESLQRLVEHGGRALAANHEAFLRELRALDDSAARVRARATELRTTQLAALRARAAAVPSEPRRAAILQQLALLPVRTTAARDAFAPFHAALHDCRILLHESPTAETAASLHEETQRIAAMKDTLTAALDAVAVTLDDVQESLRLGEAEK